MAVPCQGDSGDTAWMVVSTVLVLAMSPALAMFEAGLLRTKNTLSLVSQIFAGLLVLSLMWLLFGYSLCFSGDFGGIIGGVDKVLYIGVSDTKCVEEAPRISELLFSMFQMMFSAICPLLVTGAFAERVPFRTAMYFFILFEVFVYYPVCHWMWARGGWLKQLGAQDFAGGIVLHTTAGTASLVAAVMVGPRIDFDKHKGVVLPSNLTLATVGCALLFVGWFGFNGGSAFASSGLAVGAVASTQAGACASGVVWLMASSYRHKPSLAAMLNGAVAGLAGITPASGYISIPASLLLGLLLGGVSFYGAHALKHRLHIDDALEVTVIHGVTGVIGSLFVGVAASRDVNPASLQGLIYGHTKLFGAQCLAVFVVAVYSAAATFAIFCFLRRTLGTLRLSAYGEQIGGDWRDLGEIAYHNLIVSKPTATMQTPLLADTGAEGDLEIGVGVNAQPALHEGVDDEGPPRWFFG